MWKRLRSFQREHFGVRNRAPWVSMFSHALHQFHENDLFTPAAAMSYFGLLTLFPLLLVLLAFSNHFDIGNEMLRRAVEVYPGSREFLRSTVRSLENVSTEVIITCIVVTLWAGSWVFNVVERAINRLWGTKPRVMLRGRAPLRDSIPGAVVAGVLWEVAKYIFASSLQYFHYDQIYGSVGAVVAVLTWSYVSSLILLFGAQLSAVFHREHPSPATVNTD